MPTKDPEKIKAKNQRKWERYKADPEKYAHQLKRGRENYQKAQPARRAIINANKKKNYAAAPEKFRAIARAKRNRTKEYARELRREYGLTKAMVDAMIEERSNRCDICSGQMKPPCVDHCHRTGLVRGLLCRACNTALGRFGDDIQKVISAVRYLRRSIKELPTTIFDLPIPKTLYAIYDRRAFRHTRYDKECGRCGTAFISQRSDAKYCSRKCRDALYNANAAARNYQPVGA